MSGFKPPVNVAPVIKFGRWSLLVVGVLYGAAHQSRLSKRENKLREEEEKLRPAKEAKLAAEKKQRADKEIADLASMAGGKL